MLVFWLSFFGSVIAVALNFSAARNAPWPWKLQYYAVGTLALVYAASYVWVISGHTNAAAWSTWMRPVSAFTWLLVWSLPPFLRIRYLPKHEALMVAKTVEAVNALFEGGSDDD